jgi:hypothetical protein
MESPFRFFECTGTMNPPHPSLEGNSHDADECLLLSWEGPAVGRFKESPLGPASVYWDLEPVRAIQRAAGRRTPLPDGSSSDCGQRASVLECGGPPPLSMGACTRNSRSS